jgi:tetratricopeptide (TPR) repeat protein
MQRLTFIRRAPVVLRCLVPRPRIHTRRLALPPSRPDDVPNIKHNPYTREFPTTITQIIQVIRRFLKYSAIGVLFVGSVAIVFFQGAHIYVEKVSLASRDYLSDPNTADIAHYGWDAELENWTGPPATGGTDPSLSWKARYAIRSAWMSLNWGSATTSLSTGNGTVLSTDGRLVPAQSFLDAALQTCSDPGTRAALLELQGGVAGSMTSTQSLARAMDCYEEALHSVPVDSQHAAVLFSRMAEVLNRMGNVDQAMDYHWKAIDIVDPDHNHGIVPSACPTSPFATRILLRNLNTLSMLYATSRDLKSAFSFQTAALKLATALSHEGQPDASPAQLLHTLFIKQRAATLQLHLGEVIYAINQQDKEAVEHLFSAAIASEEVAFALMGKDREAYPEQPESSSPSGPAGTWTSTAALRLPSTSLLLDASRSATTAYHLSAILYEKRGELGREDAFRSLERAMWWCGGVEGPNPDIPMTEWEAVWREYRRLRALVHPEPRSG